jgi:peptidoglycan hydrolase-like protein with peptidoglycan-binding domain
MYARVAVLMGSWLWLCPVLGEAGTAGQERPEQRQLLTKDHLKLVQERLRTEGVYAGPLDGELNAQTEAALRAYQQQQGLPFSGAVDEATLKQLQLELPAAIQGGESR